MQFPKELGLAPNLVKITSVVHMIADQSGRVANKWHGCLVALDRQVGGARKSSTLDFKQRDLQGVGRCFPANWTARGGSPF